MWHIKVPASSANLGSGFDTLAMALSLSLECWFSLSEETGFQVRGEGHDSLPHSTENLVWKTASHLYAAKAQGSLPTGRLTIKSRIPVARGLGSSAAAIVAGLLLANTFLSPRLTREELFDWAIGLEGHPDNVAAALFGGVVLAYEEQGRMRIKSFTAPELRCVLVIPDYEVPTKKARQVLPEAVALADAVFNAQRLALWVDALNRRDWSQLGEAGRDRLHQPYRSALIPGMDALIATARDHGAKFASLSGSGPTILALVKPEDVPAVVQSLGRVAQEKVPAPVHIHEITPSYFGGECVLDGWQWHAGDAMGFNDWPDRRKINPPGH